MRISDWSSDVCSSDLFCEHGSRSPTGCSPPSGSARFQVRKMRRRQIYEGKAKVLFEGPEPGTIVQYFKDDATAFNNKKRSEERRVGKECVSTCSFWRSLDH